MALMPLDSMEVLQPVKKKLGPPSGKNSGRRRTNSIAGEKNINAQRKFPPHNPF
jgi:hypothetical protein